MDLTKKDIDNLNYIYQNNTKTASGNYDSNDIQYFLYNNFLLSTDTNLFNLMFSRQNIINEVLNSNLPGNIIEFGIMKGTFSFQIMKSLLMNGINKNLYLFDFFEDEINMSSKIEETQISEIYERINYKRNTTKHFEISAKNIGFKNLHCIKGNVETTLEPFLLENNSKFCFIYIDVDVENPTYICLSKIWNRVVKNGIIIIDDYNSQKWGPFYKIDEFLKNKNVIIKNIHNSLNEGLYIKKLD